MTELAAAGIALRLDPDGEHIGARPAAALTDDLRELIRAHKPALVEELQRQLITPSCDICGNVRYRTSLDGTRGWPECTRWARAFTLDTFGQPVTCQLFTPAAGLFEEPAKAQTEVHSDPP